MKYSYAELLTLVEFDHFTRFAARNLTAGETDELKSYLSANPEAGVVIQGTGGVRKLRWAAKGKGKSGGVRIIYYYHNHDMPLLLLNGFAKNEMENIRPAARNAYQKLIPILVQHYLPGDRQ